MQTKRLKLSPCSENDCADFIELEIDPQVMRFLNGGHAVDRGKIDPNAAFLMPNGTEDYVWTARLKMNDMFVGWFCLWPETAQVAELGYRLRSNLWGQGLASEGALALLNWGFKNQGYKRIFASAMAVNHGSRRVMEKIGMSYTRTIYTNYPEPITGSEEGDVEYEISRSAWDGE